VFSKEKTKTKNKRTPSPLCEVMFGKNEAIVLKKER
jgi:hypothetical protein